MAIRFHSEKIQFNLQQKIRHRNWLYDCINSYHKQPGEISFIFTSNAHLKRMNREFLNHDYNTDVITFDYSDGDMIAGDVYISVEQVRSNADHYRVPQSEEIRRVMVHGILHLAGYSDDTRKEKEVMREMENEALHLWLKEEDND